MEVVLKVGLVILLLGGVIWWVSNNPDPNAVPAPVEEQSGLNYQIITVEGMPCLLVKSKTYYNFTTTSATCDWSKWQPRVTP